MFVRVPGQWQVFKIPADGWVDGLNICIDDPISVLEEFQKKAALVWSGGSKLLPGEVRCPRLPASNMDCPLSLGVASWTPTASALYLCRCSPPSPAPSPLPPSPCSQDWLSPWLSSYRPVPFLHVHWTCFYLLLSSSFAWG